MPTTTDTTLHSALNALVELYNLYDDMVRYTNGVNGPSDALDRFYLRGGLRKMIEKYYTLAELDPVSVGSNEEPVELTRMLPRKIVADVVGTTAEQVALIRGDLKYYSDSVDAYRAPIPEEVTQLVTEGRVLLKQGSQVNRSGEQLAVGNLESDDISYQDGILSIGPTEIMVRSYTLEDAVLDYLINHFEPEEWVHKDRIVNWVIDELEDESKNGKSVYDKVVAINSKVKYALGTESLLFDTSRSGYIKRNY